MAWIDFNVPVEAGYPVRAYDFLPRGLRHADQLEGGKLLERYFDGIQDIWDRIVARIVALPDLWSAKDCPDFALHALKGIVGWGNKDDDAWTRRALTTAELRALIAISWLLWKWRGSDDRLVEILVYMTKARATLTDWFAMRWLLDNDPNGLPQWLLSVPGETDRDEYRSYLQIVDDGTLNRELVKRLAQVYRPFGEDVEIVFLSFLDQFEEAGNSFQWETEDGNGLVVSGGRGELLDDSQLEVVLTEDVLPASFLAVGQIAGAGSGEFGFGFDTAHTPTYDFYAVGLDVGANQLRLWKSIMPGPAETTLATVALGDAPWLMQLYPDVLYELRVQISPEGATRRIKVYLEGVEMVNVTDASVVPVIFNIWHEVGATLSAAEVAVLPLPRDSIVIGV